MERISFLWAVVLVSILVFKQGSSAVTPVFVEKGKDVVLEVMQNFVLNETDTMFWRFNHKSNFVKLALGTKPVFFRERVSVKDFSVILKNLQAADSGVYDARVIGNEDQIIVEYNVTVQDRVSPVELNVTESGEASGSSCIINATCSTADSDISSTFRCAHQMCHQDGGEQSKTTNFGASLRIYLSNVLIICNHSNQVSWTEDMTKIQDFCKQYTEHHPFPASVTIVIGIGIGIAVIIILIIVYRRCRGRRNYDTENTENTIYATPQAETTQTRDEISPSDASCVSPTSTYSLVGLHSRPAETRNNPLPESLYATVDKPAKVEKPARPCKNLQEL